MHELTMSITFVTAFINSRSLFVHVSSQCIN